MFLRGYLTHCLPLSQGVSDFPRVVVLVFPPCGRLCFPGASLFCRPTRLSVVSFITPAPTASLFPALFTCFFFFRGYHQVLIQWICSASCQRKANFAAILPVTCLCLSSSTVFHFDVYFFLSSPQRTNAASRYVERTHATSNARPQAIALKNPNEDVFKIR